MVHCYFAPILSNANWVACCWSTYPSSSFPHKIVSEYPACQPFNSGVPAGVQLVVRTTRFTYEWRTVVSVNHGMVTFDKPFRFPLKAGSGAFFVFRNVMPPSLPVAPTSWASNSTHIVIQCQHCELHHVVVACAKNGIEIFGTASNVAVVGITFEHLSTGILIHSGAKRITISHCHFESQFRGVWVRGPVLEESPLGQGTANASSGITESEIATHSIQILESSFTGILGRAISIARASDVLVSGNVVRNTGLIPGEGISGVNGMSGIVIHLDVLGAKVVNNCVHSSGYFGIRAGAYFALIENNTVTFACLQLDDCAGIYAGWGKASVGITVRGNIVLVVIGNRDGVPAPIGTSITRNLSHGIYVDDFTQHALVEGNVVAFAAGNGVNIHNAMHTVVRNNVLFANGNAQVALDEDKIAGFGGLQGTNVWGNLMVVCNGPYSAAIHEQSNFGEKSTPFDHFWLTTPSAKSNTAIYTGPDEVPRLFSELLRNARRAPYRTRSLPDFLRTHTVQFNSLVRKSKAALVFDPAEHTVQVSGLGVQHFQLGAPVVGLLRCGTTDGFACAASLSACQRPKTALHQGGVITWLYLVAVIVLIALAWVALWRTRRVKGVEDE
eukprot:TRINITY_DN16597_c0_g1_i2.p1 TRINITY_DN16597_c0_g1~~TRINITY_DN16597_c0_g1_i2.p1  ORF type:complete len:612 (+),score=47.77 TRINITY_DN16597_c0_g1_i2:219-2054(+)